GSGKRSREDKVKKIYSEMQLGQSKHGMQTANQCLHSLVTKKQITMEQAIEYSSDPEELRNMIASGGTPTTPPGQRQAAREKEPTCAWESRTRAGGVGKGVMEAEAEPEIANRLRAQGITMSKAKKKAKDIEIKLPFGWGQGVPEKDIVVFTRQFATMIDAGLPIVQCLDILASQSPNK